MSRAATTKFAVFLALLCTFFISAGQLFYKLGSEKVVSILSFFNIFVIIGVLSYFLGSFLYIIALKRGELSVIAPVLALNYVWVALLSIMFLAETVNAVRWLGIASVVVGVGIIGIGGRNGN